MIANEVKRKYNVSLLLMIFCLFVFTIGQFIPVYFVNSNTRFYYYIIIYFILIIAASRTVYKWVYKKEKSSRSSARFYSILIGGFTFIIFGFWTLGMSLAVWSEAATFYVSKVNPNVRIISRYINEGAFGGGTDPSDYHVVLHRPLLYFFKLETAIDTTKIDKAVWREPDE